MSIADNIIKYKTELEASGARLIAVSKNHPAEAVKEAYDAGQRVFGENLVQEMVDKQQQLPADIQWHLIGHLQSNKVKYITPFVQMIHSVDSLKLLKEIDKQAKKSNRVVDCLLQIYIADEDSKFGMDYDEAIELLRSEDYQSMQHIRIRGLMGMATNNVSDKQVQTEFEELSVLFDGLKQSFFKEQADFNELSMGMSADYKLALEEGSTMVRIGSSIFGTRNIRH
jgi:pyridoxal phosphate enzyme (YggS family)